MQNALCNIAFIYILEYVFNIRRAVHLHVQKDAKTPPGARTIGVSADVDTIYGTSLKYMYTE